MSLVGLEMVILIFTLSNGRIEGCSLAVESLLACLGLELRPSCWEFVCRLASRFETLRMQGVIDSFVVAAWEQIDPVDLSIGQLIRRQALDVALQVIRVVRTVAPRLLVRPRLFR